MLAQRTWRSRCYSYYSLIDFPHDYFLRFLKIMLMGIDSLNFLFFSALQFMKDWNHLCLREWFENLSHNQSPDLRLVIFIWVGKWRMISMIFFLGFTPSVVMKNPENSSFVSAKWNLFKNNSNMLSVGYIINCVLDWGHQRIVPMWLSSKQRFFEILRL